MKYFLISLLLLTGCGSTGSKTSAVFSNYRIYEHANFSSEEECKKAQQEFLVNCYKIVRFSPDGAANFIVTDIMNLGTYEVSGNKVKLNFKTGSEVGLEIEFTLSSDEKSLTDPQGLVFTLRENDS